MIDIAKICIIALIVCFVVVFLKQQKPEYAVILSATVCVIVVLFLVTPAREMFEHFYDIFEKFNIQGTYILIIAKIVGISYITAITANIAKDCGESAIGTKVEIAGKIAILFCTFPILQNILEQVALLLG